MAPKVIDSEGLLADELNDLLNVFLYNPGENSRKLLAEALWENKAGIIAALRTVVSLREANDTWVTQFGPAAALRTPPPAAGREAIALTLYDTRFPHRNWSMASTDERALTLKQADAILALTPSQSDRQQKDEASVLPRGVAATTDQVECGAMALAMADHMDWGQTPSMMKAEYRSRSSICLKGAALSDCKGGRSDG